MAEADLSRETDNIEFAKTELAKLREASTGTIFNLAREFSLEDGMRDAELLQSKASVAVAKVQSKLEVLRKFTKPKQIKELQIEVEKARLGRAVQRGRMAAREAEAREAGGGRQKAVQPVTPQRGHASAVGGAISIAKEIKSKLDLARNEREPSVAARNEIIDLTARLQALIAQVPATMAADQWAALKPSVREAALRYLRPQSKTEAK